MKIVNAFDLHKSTPNYPPDIIEGLLQERQTMLLVGPSKAGKSFLLAQLAVSLCGAGGDMFLDTYKCRKVKVLYVDIENGERETKSRIDEQVKALCLTNEKIANLNSLTLAFDPPRTEEFDSEVLKAIKETGSEVLILDPIYPLFLGFDENSSTGARQLMNRVDAIKRETGCAVILCHHQSKGPKYDCDILDRGAGHGILTRSPDTILDMSPMSSSWKSELYAPDAIPIKISTKQRHFKSISLNVVFDYPLFKVDPTLRRKTQNERAADKVQRTIARDKDRLSKITSAFETLSSLAEAPVKLSDLANQLHSDIKTVRDWIKESTGGAFTVNKGIVYRSLNKTP